jgi:hypothetical protein
VAVISRQYGAVAILDALSASSYGDREIQEFLRSRQRVLKEIDEWVGDVHGSVKIEPEELVIFTFNDTIVIVLQAGEASLGLAKATSFAALLRKFLVDSLASGLLFRGAALGTFYVDENTHTVMGEAVTDASQWYERSEWMGVHWTPRSFVKLTLLFRLKKESKEWAFLPYPVPLHQGASLRTYAINWPKIFLVKGLRPWGKDQQDPRTKLLEFLARHRIPLGTEQKYFNTIAFFDHAIAAENARQGKSA